MSKIFRLHKGSSDGVTDWQSSKQHIGETYINTIEDPAGDNAKKQITSIPSPFARLDLVRTAFRYITTKKQLDGNTIYHRIVSEAFDVAELFFNADSLKDKIEIISWNAGILSISGKNIQIDDNSDLGKLLTSKNKKHKLLGETLQMFLMQDREAYNFEMLKGIYLLNYKKGPELVNIIGGTSPASLFFSSANEDIRSYINIQFGEHKVFDNNYYPLFRRSENFIKYIFALKESFGTFASLFPDINTYLDLTLIRPECEGVLKEAIQSIDADTYSKTYQDIRFGAGDGLQVEILGNNLKSYVQGVLKSDFEIAATKKTGKRPLVLPNEAFNEPVNYVDGKWKAEYRAPYTDSRPLESRTLPHQEHIKYPYLTVSDLLEPYIMRIPYPVNKEKYFNGNFNEKSYGYALPLKKEIFQYFSIKDVMGILPDGKNFFELIKQAGDSVEAVIRLPIQKGKYIKFSRMYYLNQHQDQIQQPEVEENKGVIVEYLFGFAIYPFLKTGSDNSAEYRAILIDSDTLDARTKTNKYEMAFYKESATTSDKDKIDEPAVKTRIRSDKNAGNLATSIYQVLNKEFDIVEIRPNAYSKGMLIPLMKTFGNGPDKFTFAIDFGTTNTHIEYKVNEEEPQPFEIGETDMQIGSLLNNDTETMELLKRAQSMFGFGISMLTDLTPKEFMPDKIGRNYDYRFPMRTVIGEDNKLTKNTPTYTLADFNIPFVYEKSVMPPNSKNTTNLKWTNFSHTDIDKKRVQAYIEKLAILIRNKVLMNNGSLEDTRIIWFYPSSMTETRRDTLEATWKEFAQKYISKTIKPLKLSESIAPFYYLKERANILAYDRPVASIDIGGGTTDIVIYINNVPVHLTSFRFASNAILGDGYGGSMAGNSYIKKYKPIIDDLLKSDVNVNDLREVMKQVEGKNSTSELITYFYSLENHTAIKNNNLELSFSKLLKGDEQSKIIFLFFYASIAYHLAKMMKALKLEAPRYIAFSGTGSKVVNIIDSNTELKNLTAYTNVIFSDVYGEAINSIELMQSPEPKEITCKGGLFCKEVPDDIENIKTVLIGDIENTILNASADTNIKYKGLNENTELLSSVKKEVELFIDKFFSWHNKFNYYNKFGASPREFDSIKIKMKEDLLNYLKAGVGEKLKEVNDNLNSSLEEPLFFYPLIGILNKISQNIYNVTSNAAEA